MSDLRITTVPRDLYYHEIDYVRALEDALKMFVARLEANGNWDDGCFYYNGTSASELQEPLSRARKALAS